MGLFSFLLGGASNTEPLADVQAKVRQGQAVLVDCREHDEWGDGHLREAHMLSLSKLRSNPALANQLPKDKPVYLHWRAGGRAMLAARLLKKLGYDARPLRQSFETLARSGFTRAA